MSDRLFVTFEWSSWISYPSVIEFQKTIVTSKRSVIASVTFVCQIVGDLWIEFVEFLLRYRVRITSDIRNL